MGLLDLDEIEILKAVTPVVRQLESGWNDGHYETFIQCVAPDKIEAIDIHNFTKQRNEAMKELGQSTLGKAIKVHLNPTNVVLIWEVLYEKRPEPGIGVYCFKEIEGSIKVESSLHHH